MAARFVFTTRDWMWFCVVFAMAIGWGMHVRYSTLLESPALSTPYTTPIGFDELQQLSNAQRDQLRKIKNENEVLRYAVEQTLKDNQKKEFTGHKKHMEEVISIREENSGFSP